MKIGIVGLGKIARDQHVPAVLASRSFVLAGTADPAGRFPDVPAFSSLTDMLAACALDAVAICTPPAARAVLAAEAVAAGVHVMLEKPPAATVTEAEALVAQAKKAGVTMFAAWHSREAAGVATARLWLHGRATRSVRIDWRENIREWHPGQDWILDHEGFGVFDPGINALSILTALLPQKVVVKGASFDIPLGRAAPMAAELDLTLADGTPVSASFDFLKEGRPNWSLEIIADDGEQLTLTHGGAKCVVNGAEVGGPNEEYPSLYNRFAQLIEARQSEVDVAPLRIVEAAWQIADCRTVVPFHFNPETEMAVKDVPGLSASAADSEIVCIWDAEALLGEGPLWDDRTGSLWSVDIKRGLIHRCNEHGGQRASFNIGGTPSFIVPRTDGGFIVGNGHVLQLFDGERVTGELRPVALPYGARINDATVDPSGRLWFGSMDDNERANLGGVYLFDGAAASLAGGSAVITNGPAVSGDGRLLYHVDTLQRTIWRFDIGDRGELKNGTVFARIEQGAGTPDGVTIDADDHIWVGLWGGWCARRYNPLGEMTQQVGFPCANITKLAFGGPDRKTAFATSARIGLSDAALDQQPLAGSIFSFRVEVPGLATPRVRICDRDV